MSDIFVRLLNFNKSVFTPKDTSAASETHGDKSQEERAVMNENAA